MHMINRLWAKTNRTFYDLRNIMWHSGPAKTISKQFDLLPGKSVIIFNAIEGGRIEGIECSAANAFEGLNNLVDIEIDWDNDKTPAVYCPLADFFGYAFGKNAMQG